MLCLWSIVVHNPLAFSAAVISAFKQRTWLTVRNRFLSIRALDSIFAAAEDVVAMFNLEFFCAAQGAFALAFFAWTTPLVVILTANTLLVLPKPMVFNTTCPNVRSLNFSFEETYDFRAPDKVDQAFELPLSLWNTTKREDGSDPNWFDYYTGPNTFIQQSATLAAFLKEVVPRKNSSMDTCGAGWNCTFLIEFTGPGYQCSEVASVSPFYYFIHFRDYCLQMTASTPSRAVSMCILKLPAGTTLTKP